MRKIIMPAASRVWLTNVTYFFCRSISKSNINSITDLFTNEPLHVDHCNVGKIVFRPRHIYSSRDSSEREKLPLLIPIGVVSGIMISINYFHRPPPPFSSIWEKP